MYSQKRNCEGLSPNFYIHVSVSDLRIDSQDRSTYFPSDRSWEYINRSQTHEYGNWDWSRTFPFLRIFCFEISVFFLCSTWRRPRGRAICSENKEERAAFQQPCRPCPGGRVSFETSFDSKQPKLEPKLVSALSETKFVSFVSLLYRNRECRCFDWTETNRRPTETE